MNQLMSTAFIVAAIAAVPVESRRQSDDKQIKLTLKEQKAELAKLRKVYSSVNKMPPKNGRWIEVQAGRVEGKHWYKGWMLRESATEIQLLTGKGHKETFDKRKLAAKKPPAEFEWSDVWAVRKGDFVKHCRDMMTKKKKKVKDDAPFGSIFIQHLRAQADDAVLDAARMACWASAIGHKNLAGQLLKRAVQKLSERRETFSRFGPNKKLHQFVADNTTPHEQDFSGAAADEPMAARRHSLQWKLALAKIPYRSDRGSILKEIKQLKRLVAEDKAWKEPTKAAFAKLNVKQKAAYWLYHLRNLNVRQTSQPGMCMVLTDSPWSFMQSHHFAKKGVPNPAVELKKLGYGVLPQIIAHLDDERPTKCVGYWRSFAPDSYYTLKYGDCCQQIFEAIALHTIYERRTTNGYPLRDGLGKRCKERAAKWWRQFKKKGEKQVLIEATKRGNRDSSSNAERLVKKYPNIAFEPIRTGIRGAKEAWIRSNMLNYMRGLKDKRVVTFLRKEATKGPHLYARVNAIEGLLERSQEDAVTLLVAEWGKLDPENDNWDNSWGAERLQDAMVRCGKMKAIAALAAKWKKIPLEWRHRILEHFQGAKKDYAKKPFTTNANKAVEKLLIARLNEKEEDYRLYRTCDLAANALAVRWNRPKLFILTAPLSVRNRAVVMIHNVWRQKQGLKPLPLPKPRRIPPVAKVVVAPFIKTIIESSSAKPRLEATVAVERIGLGALPHIRKKLASLSKKHAARKHLSKLANRLACIVSEIRFSDDSIARPAKMLKVAKRLKNQPLTSKAFVELLVAIHKAVPVKSEGMVIALDRDGNDTGIQLEIRVLPRREPAIGGSVHLRRREAVFLDRREIYNNAGVTVGIGGQKTPSEWDSATWKGLAIALQRALEAPPQKQFQVCAEVTRGR